MIYDRSAVEQAAAGREGFWAYRGSLANNALRHLQLLWIPLTLFQSIGFACVGLREPIAKH